MNIQWDVQDYAKPFDFVHKYGEDVLKHLPAFPKSGRHFLQCGLSLDR